MRGSVEEICDRLGTCGLVVRSGRQEKLGSGIFYLLRRRMNNKILTIASLIQAF
jgi:hypothetical protein